MEQARALPGRLKERTFIRNHIVTRDGPHHCAIPALHRPDDERTSRRSTALSQTRATAC